VLQHLHAVFAETGRWCERTVVVAGDAELMPFVWHVAHLRMHQRAEEAPVVQLWIGEQVARALHHSSRHASGL
jgi:hypothetical protein